ncbi:hypothetical protein HanRHA438_Chr07g0325271 [Helianthus annuus]|nr:hypothetical protein HanRHA438_Chr07g0325271 [Helianthus annuus]
MFEVPFITTVEACNGVDIKPILRIFLSFQRSSTSTSHEVFGPSNCTCKSPLNIHQLHFFLVDLLIIFIGHVDVSKLTRYQTTVSTDHCIDNFHVLLSNFNAEV